MPNTPASLDLSFLRNREALKRIAAVTGAFAAIGLLYGLLAPKWYRSTLTVVPARSQKAGGLSSLVGGELAGLAAGFDMLGGADVARIAAVLQSVSVTDAVIEKFDLRARYDEKYQEKARDALWRHCDVKTLIKPQLVQLSCEDKDPRFVQQMLAFFAEHGNEVFRRVGVSSASEEVRFLEKRVAELRQQADDAAARMREFQEKYQVLDIDTQTKAVVSSMAALNSQRISKQLELEYARTFSSQDEAALQQLRSQIAVLDEKLHDLENVPPPAEPPVEKRSGRGKDANSAMFPAALAVPKLRAEFESLYRDRKVSETTLVFALERLEGARANEARDVSTFVVLDAPALPTRHSWPKRLLILAISVIAGLVLSFGIESVRLVGGIAALLSGGTPSRPVSPPTRHA